MSWLLVALIPVLLMVATFGLERIEAGLTRAAAAPPEHAGSLASVEVDRVVPRPRAIPAAPVQPVACMLHRLADADGAPPLLPHHAPPRDLPTHRYEASLSATRQS